MYSIKKYIAYKFKLKKTSACLALVLHFFFVALLFECFNFGLFAKRLPFMNMFSINILNGQFSSKCPSSGNCTVRKCIMWFTHNKKLWPGC